MKKKLQNVAEIINRIKSVYDFTTDADVAHFLEIKPGTIAAWKMRKTFDIQVIATKCSEINLHWLLTGEGDKGLNEKPMDGVSKKIIAMLKDMPEDEKRDVLKALEKEKLLATLLQERGMVGNSRE